MDESVSGVGVLDKAVAILGAVERGATTLPAIVTATGLNRATAHRLGSALVVHGLLRRDTAGGYLPGLRLLALGRAAAQTAPLSAAAQPVLDRLRDGTGESAQLYVRDGSVRVCVAAAESPHGLRTIVPVGAELTISAGSAGRILRLDEDALAAGWTSSIGEREAGVASVSAPVFDGGRVVAAVSVSGPLDRLGPDPGARFATAVMGAARALETAAGLDRPPRT